jgi:hypothetical protein
MLGGVGLVVTTFAAAASVAGRRAADNDLVPALDDYGVPFDLTILNHAAAWRAIAVGLVGFALWAIVGVGLAAFAGRWVVPVLSVPLGWLVGWGVVEWFALGDGAVRHREHRDRPLPLASPPGYPRAGRVPL